MDIQLIILIFIIAFAVSYLGTRFYKTVVKKQHAGSCPDCDVHDAGIKEKKKL